jgi:PIN domain nuclease of toxin-antitoxin system
MTLLLDTHAFLWLAEGDRRLGRVARATIVAAGETTYLSAAVIWEIAIKQALGRLALAMPLEDIVAGGYETGIVRPLPVEDRHALAVRDLARLHKDPFDRMLVAQSRVEGCKLVTADRIFARYPVETLPADR